MNEKLLARYGLRHNPFVQAIPADALWQPPGADAFFFRVEDVILDGGFVLLCGEPGLGKSKVLHLLSERLLRMGGDIAIGVMERPQSTVSDFYRELGELFGVNLRPANRYGGFKALRERWNEHIQSTLMRPVLLVDEAQEMASHCLTELRLLSSARFDSACILTTVLAGDARLPERFRARDLASLGSRIRTRWMLEPWSTSAMKSFLDHALDSAGGNHLMTEGLQTTLVEHAGGNLRMLCTMADELLRAGVERDAQRLDEALYMELYARPAPTTAARSPRRKPR